MTESLSYTFTDEASITRMMGVLSLTDYLNEVDVDGADAGVDTAAIIADIVAEATDEVYIRCQPFYTMDVLANSSYVRRLATWIGCFLLSQRKGEPARYEAKYQSAIDLLDKVMTGKVQLPRMPQRSDLVPCHSNYVIDDRFVKQRARVERETSTGGSYSGQNVDITYDPTLR